MKTDASNLVTNAEETPPIEDQPDQGPIPEEKWSPPQWEYHRVKSPDREPVTASVLNELGRQGWEMVSVLHIGGDINYIFKRMK